MRAYWARGFFEELGAESLILLSFLAYRTRPEPESVNTLAKKLQTRWKTIKDALDALEDARFIVIKKTNKGMVIRVTEPDWIDATPDFLTP